MIIHVSYTMYLLIYIVVWFVCSLSRLWCCWQISLLRLGAMYIPLGFFTYILYILYAHVRIIKDWLNWIVLQKLTKPGYLKEMHNTYITQFDAILWTFALDLTTQFIYIHSANCHSMPKKPLLWWWKLPVDAKVTGLVLNVTVSLW